LINTYNKLIIFDLDGVLIDSREIHYETLNMALAEIADDFVITREEHLSRYDGLSTSRKLKMLTDEKNLPEHYHGHIWRSKQHYTKEFLLNKTKKNLYLIGLCSWIKLNGYKLACASNAIRETVETSLKSLGILEYFDYMVSNQDVERSKPYPDMYWKCMIECNAIPASTIIVEDSHIGREGAVASGAHLLEVEDPRDLTREKIMSQMEWLDMKQSGQIKMKWNDNKLNVLIPMAGAGSRFADAGYTFPKPLIEVKGKPMIQLVVENLNIEANFIYIVQKEHYKKYNLKYMLELITPGCEIIQVDGVTEGAACTTLLAKNLINNSNPLLICNSDQYIEWDSNECMYAFKADGIDAGILTFKSTHPKWSYAKVGDDGFVSEVAEKQPISDNATVGLYYWSHGKDYVKFAEQMIEKDIRTNGEFYVCPVFNQAIEAGKKVRVKQIDRMWGIGTPEDLNTFLRDN